MAYCWRYQTTSFCHSKYTPPEPQGKYWSIIGFQAIFCRFHHSFKLWIYCQVQIRNLKIQGFPWINSINSTTLNGKSCGAVGKKPRMYLFLDRISQHIHTKYTSRQSKNMSRNSSFARLSFQSTNCVCFEQMALKSTSQDYCSKAALIINYHMTRSSWRGQQR